jgi:hypothetical protein
MLALVLVPSVFGQGAKGSITGRVTDTGGGVLQGADVTVEPGDIKVISDAQGQFLITGLTPAAYTVTITYVGFTNAVKSVNVTAGQVANADALLTVA